MSNLNKIILDLCGGTGAWSKPYKEAGYDVRLITLPTFDVTDPYVIEQCIALKPHGILSAPPCTMFSLARTNAKVPRDLKQGMEVVTACLKIIWECRQKERLSWWAMENPRGLLRQFLGRPPFVFEQWEFGDMGIKPTDLWGYFNAPKKTKKIRPVNLTKRFPNGRLNAIGWTTSAEKRAITPPGFATAFFKANP